MRLLAAEASRWVARRGIWVATAAGLLVVAFMCMVLVQSVRPPSGLEVEAAERGYASHLADWEQHKDEWYAECLEHADDGAEECDHMLARPTLSEWVPQPIRAPEALTQAGYAGSILGALLALVLAATFWGAEYRHGTVATWLTFVPSRTRVWLSRFAVLTVAGALVTALCIGLTVGVTAVGVATMQGAAGFTGPLDDAFALSGRGVGLGALFAVIGGALAVLFRQTIAPVLLPLVYFVGQLFFGLFAAIPGWSRAQVWLPETNIRAYMEGGTVYSETVLRTLPGGSVQTEMVARTLPFAHGLVYLLVIAGLVAIASHLAFRRRDVT